MDQATNHPSHTLVGLRELPDDNAAGSFGPGYGARFARAALECERIGLSLQRLEPDARQTFAHRHEADEEVYVVLSGSGVATVDDESIALQPWSALRVAPTAVRTFAAGPDGMEFLAFGSHSGEDGTILPL
jgi:gentisate 1,2-dioxygenase